MTNVVNIKNYQRFNAKASALNMRILKAKVEDMRLADFRKDANVNEVASEKTISNERQ